MAEAAVAKQQKPETGQMRRWLDVEAPLFGGGLFGVNPFALMRQFAEDMDRVFRQEPAAGGWTPAIEVKQAEGKMLVKADLPGMKKEDIHVNIAEGNLTLEGERKAEKEEKREGYYRSERSYGKFFRSIPLPEGAMVDQATALFKDGVLEVAVPVPEKAVKSQTIPVK